MSRCAMPFFRARPAAHGESRRTRWARWARKVLLGVTVLVASEAFGLVVLARYLDRPWLKARVQAFVRSAEGVDIDYGTLRLQWLSGVDVGDLVVRQPSELRAVAPDLVRVGRLEARWSLSSLWGRGPRARSITLSDMALTVVVDEHGRTSFDAIPLTEPAPPPVAPLPLSHRAGDALGGTPAAGRVDLEEATLVLIKTREGRVAERDTVRDVALTMATEAAAPGWSAHVRVGSPAAPLALALEREGTEAPAGAARAALWLTVDATPSELVAAVDVRVLTQSFAPNLGDLEGSEWLHAEAKALFEPAASRTVVTLERGVAAGGAATVEASIEVPDTGDPLVHHAQGDIDGARFFAWAPASLVPVTAERARFHYQVDALRLGTFPQLAEDGRITVDADVANVRLRLPGGTVEVSGGTLRVRSHPTADPAGPSTGGLELQASIALDRVRAERGGQRIEVRDVGAELKLDGLRFGDADVLATRGDLALKLAAGGLDVQTPATRVTIVGLALDARVHSEGHAPFAFDVDAPMSRLRVLGAGARLLTNGPARLALHVHDAYPDVSRPLASRGVLQGSLDLGQTRASLDLTKGAATVDYDLRASTPSLTFVRPFLSRSLEAVAPWDEMAISLRSTGRLEDLTERAPSLREDTELEVERPAYAGVAARSISLALHSEGTTAHQKAEADLKTKALTVNGEAANDDRITLSAALDRDRPSLKLKLVTTGRTESTLDASMSFDRARRAVVVDLRGRVAGLAAVAPLASGLHGLEGLDLTRLALDVSVRGALLGAVSDVGADGTMKLAPAPSLTAGVEGTADVHLENVRWTRGDLALEAPVANWHGEMQVTGRVARRTVQSHVDVEKLHVGLGRHVIDVSGLADQSTAVVTGDLANPDSELTLHTTTRSITQDFMADYPAGDVSAMLSVQRDPEGLVHISHATIRNAAGGTALDITGGIDLGAGRQRLSMTAAVEQDLGLASRAPERFAGRGQVKLEATIESPDLRTYRTRANVKAAGVSVHVPGAGVEVDAVEAQIPVTATLEVVDGGVVMKRDTRLNPYSMLRFADQHPLLSRSGFLSIGRLKTPLVSIAPLVGNLEIEQNLVSLRQFEMGVRGGRITGQCALDWDGVKSTVELHVRANGVQSSHGEPFDGNIAVVLSAADRTLDGRAEILRIGKRHLLDLLDLDDPLRVDPAMNRIRGALAFGYPDRLRLVFDHGFASARLELGGLARFISIDEMHGIPMGPILDKLIAPVLDPKGSP